MIVLSFSSKHKNMKPKEVMVRVLSHTRAGIQWGIGVFIITEPFYKPSPEQSDSEAFATAVAVSRSIKRAAAANSG